MAAMAVPLGVASKLQVKPGHTVAVLGRPGDVDLGLSNEAAPPEHAGAVVAFVTTAADLDQAPAHALAWIAYPKAGQLGTDLNRDRLVTSVAEAGVQPVRQIAIDATWSALRFRPAATQ